MRTPKLLTDTRCAHLQTAKDALVYAGKAYHAHGIPTGGIDAVIARLKPDDEQKQAAAEEDIDDDWIPLTDADRQRAFESMPDMLDGFLKTWGWLHFARAIESICREKNAKYITPSKGPI
jgi:hypothetical protein